MLTTHPFCANRRKLAGEATVEEVFSAAIRCAKEGQDTAKLNEKGHYVDASELVPTVSEFLTLPFIDGKSVTDVFDQAVFYASEKA